VRKIGQKKTRTAKIFPILKIIIFRLKFFVVKNASKFHAKIRKKYVLFWAENRDFRADFNFRKIRIRSKIAKKFWKNLKKNEKNCVKKII